MDESVERKCFMLEEKQCIKSCGHCLKTCKLEPLRSCDCPDPEHCDWPGYE